MIHGLRCAPPGGYRPRPRWGRSIGAAQTTDAEFVDVGSFDFLIAPEGRRILDAKHLLPTPASHRLFD